MRSRAVYLALLAAWVVALWFGLDWAEAPKSAPAAVPTTQVAWKDFFTANVLPRLPIADNFVTPLRPPDGNGSFISLPFLEQGHLGEDWTTAKGDAALGEPVCSIGDGWVAVAQDFENAWGKVIFIDYRLAPGRYPPFIEVMYAQLQEMDVTAGEFVKAGQKIGTVGNAGGIYQGLAHLHWEVRDTVGLGLGLGFSDNRDGLLAPSDFLAAHRGDRTGQPLQVKVLAPNQRAGWGTDY
jgi:murein DD-endopeptidase MepM/ murein hydrolase activator NlpD